MATQVLAIANTVNQAIEFALSQDTLVWVHGPRGQGVVGIEIKGSDGLFSDLTSMGDGVRSGVLPAGDYKVTRISGTCGFQRAA